jgi:hypothetical protein
VDIPSFLALIAIRGSRAVLKHFPLQAKCGILPHHATTPHLVFPIFRNVQAAVPRFASKFEVRPEMSYLDIRRRFPKLIVWRKQNLIN